MSAKKTNGNAVDIATLNEMIDELQAKNAGLVLDNTDLQKQNELMVQQHTKMEDRYNEERKKRRDAQIIISDYEARVNCLETQLAVARELRNMEQRKRHASIPKFVIVAFVALVALMASFTLQKLCIIGPSLSFGIQCGMAMVITWCYAIIWDRSRK